MKRELPHSLATTVTPINPLVEGEITFCGCCGVKGRTWVDQHPNVPVYGGNYIFYTCGETHPDPSEVAGLDWRDYAMIKDNDIGIAMLVSWVDEDKEKERVGQ